MRILKRKKEKQEQKYITRPDDCTIHFKKKHNTERVHNRVEKQKNTKPLNVPIKTRSKKEDNPRVKKIKQGKIRRKLINSAMLALIITLALAGGYTTLTFITDLRGGTTLEDMGDYQVSIVGFDTVPIYPQSEFVYEDMKDRESVQNMLSRGMSVYRLPTNTTSEQVYNYYKEKLPEYNWNKELRVQTSTAEKLFGQYWTKEHKGLRVYIQNNDLWYETTSVEEAQNALTERRKRELQRKRILKAEGEQKLLPHYPWQLDIPGDYRIEYTEQEHGEDVKITEIGSDKKYLITPLENKEDTTLDEYLEIFADEKDIEVTERFMETEYHHGDKIMHFTFEKGEGILVVNRINYKTYVMYTNTIENEFFDYMIENIHEP